MILAIDRNSFNYILKYNFLTISLNHIIDLSDEDIDENTKEISDFIISEFDRVLPIFELDHEVLLLKVQKAKLEMNGRINLSFNSILKVYPLTEKAKNLLVGKLNQSLLISEPRFESIIEKVKLLRAVNNRQLLFNKLSKIFLIDKKPSASFSKNVELIVQKLLKNENAGKSYLANLLEYNYSPNEISSGNIEYFEKIGIIAWIEAKSNSEGYTGSTYFRQCEKYKSKINDGDYAKGFRTYLNIIKDFNIDFKESHLKMCKIINQDQDGIDMFKVSYYFLALKSRLNKNNYELIELFEDIVRDIHSDNRIMIHVLYLISFTFSFEQLYESLHILEKSPLLKSKFINKDAQTIYDELNTKTKSSDSQITDEGGEDQISQQSSQENQAENNEKETEFQNDSERIELEQAKYSQLNEEPKNVSEPKNIYATGSNIELTKNNINQTGKIDGLETSNQSKKIVKNEDNKDLFSNNFDDLRKQLIDKSKKLLKNPSQGSEETLIILEDLYLKDKKFSFKQLEVELNNEGKLKKADGSLYKQVANVLELFKELK